MKLSLTNNKLLIMMAMCLLFLWATTKATAGQSNASYHVITKIFIDKKLVSSPEIIVSIGQTASLAMSNQAGAQSFKIKMAINGKTVLEKSSVLKVNFDIKYTDGKKTISSSPVLLLVPGQENKANFVSNGNRLEIFALATLEGVSLIHNPK